jgi:NAD-dependent SIR2 family protein deacetylase
MSTGDGVPTFRRAGGLWTRGREDIINIDIAAVQPGFQYQAIIALEKSGFVNWVVAQNYDNSFRKSGFPAENLSEIH